MTGIARVFLVVGALSAALAVVLGAFGAHAMRGRLGADMLEVYRTASQYHLWHSLGLILVGLLAHHLPASMWAKTSGALMIAGLVVFSGSLYALSLTGLRGLGAITPLGGLAFILGWLALALAAWRG